MRLLLFVTVILFACDASAAKPGRSKDTPSSLMPSGSGAMGRGMYFPKVGKGVVNPRTGGYLMQSGRGGYIDTRSGRFIPSTRWRSDDE